MAKITEMKLKLKETRGELASLRAQRTSGVAGLEEPIDEAVARIATLNGTLRDLKGRLRARVKKEIPEFAKALSTLCRVNLPFRVEILVNPYHTFKERIFDPSDADSTERLMNRHLWHIERSTCKTVSLEDRTADIFSLYRIHFDPMSLSPKELQLKLDSFYILTQCTLEDAIPLPSAPSSADAPRGYVIQLD
jgi:ribosomal protein L29